VHFRRGNRDRYIGGDGTQRGRLGGLGDGEDQFMFVSDFGRGVCRERVEGVIEAERDIHRTPMSQRVVVR
jgi:hypothetical protein